MPSTIRRLDLYIRSNDGALAAGSRRIDLSSVPGTPNRDDGRAVASFADGRVVAQIEGMSAVVVGSLTEHGRFVAANQRAHAVQGPEARAAAGGGRDTE